MDLLLVMLLLAMSLIDRRGYGGWFVIVAFIIYLSWVFRCFGLKEKIVNNFPYLTNHLYSLYERKVLSNKDRKSIKGGEEHDCRRRKRVKP